MLADYRMNLGVACAAPIFYRVEACSAKGLPSRRRVSRRGFAEGEHHRCGSNMRQNRGFERDRESMKSESALKKVPKSLPCGYWVTVQQEHRSLKKRSCGLNRRRNILVFARA